MPYVRVLVIEDNTDLAANVVDYLEGHGHLVDWAGDGLLGLRQALSGEHDAIVLDLGLPWMDGMELCARLRTQCRSDVPVLMLTARDELQDKLAGFEVGADDYLVKPFSLAELEARLTALARRRGAFPARTERLHVGDLVLDLATMRVERAGQAIRLPRTALRLLEILMRNSHRVVTRRELIEALWGSSPPEGDALRAHIHILRAAIDRGFDRPLLATVQGIGYRLTAQGSLQA